MAVGSTSGVSRAGLHEPESAPAHTSPRTRDLAAATTAADEQPVAAAAAATAAPAPEEAAPPAEPAAACCDARKICHQGTGEQVMMFTYTACEGREEEFEEIIQRVAHGFYNMQTGIRDMRVCHPRVGEAAFCITFTGRADMERFKAGPARDAWVELQPVVREGGEKYTAGCLMPDTNTFVNLIDMLRKKIVGSSYATHDVEGVRREICKWFPRRHEWEKFIHWDESPKKYTRNLMYGDEKMDVILMCWPPHCSSTIHDHDESSCWAYCIEGEVKETQYTMPCFDRTFYSSEGAKAGAVGRCTDLREKCVSSMRGGDCAYVTNAIGLHRVHNDTDKPAYTMHVYAPGLRKFKIFGQSGDVAVNALAEAPMTSIDGVRQASWTSATNPDGVVDIAAWNTAQRGKTA